MDRSTIKPIKIGVYPEHHLEPRSCFRRHSRICSIQCPRWCRWHRPWQGIRGRRPLACKRRRPGAGMAPVAVEKSPESRVWTPPKYPCHQILSSISMNFHSKHYDIMITCPLLSGLKLKKKNLSHSLAALALPQPESLFSAAFVPRVGRQQNKKRTWRRKITTGIMDS